MTTNPDSHRPAGRFQPLRKIGCFTFVALGCLLAETNATTLASSSGTTVSGAGGSAAAVSSCMIMSDGTSWSGGAVGVQGAGSTKVGGGSPLAANVAFKFSIGSFVDSMNTAYGAGRWTVSNIKLTLQYTLYTNNSRFGAGAGTFDIYWVGNDSWIQGTSNPVYATSSSALESWAGAVALVGSETYDWTTPDYAGTLADLNTGAWVTDKSGSRQSTVSYELDIASLLRSDITGASAGGDAALSFYLMATSSAIGMTIFTGGGNSQPTLTFDVVTSPVPESGAYGAALAGVCALLTIRRRRRI